MWNQVHQKEGEWLKTLKMAIKKDCITLNPRRKKWLQLEIYLELKDIVYFDKEKRDMKWNKITQSKSKTPITRSLHCKFKCITVALDRTQHGLYSI